MFDRPVFAKILEVFMVYIGRIVLELEKQSEGDSHLGVSYTSGGPLILSAQQIRAGGNSRLLDSLAILVKIKLSDTFWFKS